MLSCSTLPARPSATDGRISTSTRAPDSHAACSAGDATDCASLVEALGRAVVCVEGDERAFKVTTPSDLARARQLAGPGEDDG